MATIYKFIIEQKAAAEKSGRKGGESTKSTRATKGAAKKGKMVSIFGGEKGGVEHNRKMRALNPLINRMTGGAWEKGMRVGRAGLGLVQRNDETGKLGLSGPAIAILIAFFLKIGMDILKFYQDRAKEQNTQNFKQLENGVGAVSGQYKVSTNFWTGRHEYNQNK